MAYLYSCTTRLNTDGPSRTLPGQIGKKEANPDSQTKYQPILGPSRLDIDILSHSYWSSTSSSDAQSTILVLVKNNRASNTVKPSVSVSAVVIRWLCMMTLQSKELPGRMKVRLVERDIGFTQETWATSYPKVSPLLSWTWPTIHCTLNLTVCCVYILAERTKVLCFGMRRVQCMTKCCCVTRRDEIRVRIWSTK